MRDVALYYGCHKDTGHFLWVRGMFRAQALHIQDLGGTYGLIDGGFVPHDSLQQGRAWVSQVGDLTFLAMADNSIDSRPGSHSTFVFRGRLSYEEMVSRSKLVFPEVWFRFKFEVYPAEPVVAPPTQKNVAGENCPACTEPEVEAETPRTVYACGSSDYDQRPGSFLQGPRCKVIIGLKVP